MRSTILFTGLVMTTAICAEDWPEFRGPTGQGIATATNVPVHWSGASNVVWKTRIPGSGWSSPVLADGRLYVTTGVTSSSAAGTSLRAICVDAADGKIIWDVEALTADASAAQELHQKNSLASPTPVVRDGRLYGHFGHMGTAALDLKGEVIWRQTGLKYSSLHGNGGSPALVGDLLVFGCDGTANPELVALEASSGKIRWKTPRNTSAKNTFSFSTPLAIEVAGSTQIISPTSGFVGSYDPADGREIWRVKYGEGFSVISRPTYAHGLLFISSSFTRPVLYAVNPLEAKGDATGRSVAWTYSKGVPNTSSPVVVGDEIYFVSDAGIATCLDVRTGKDHWSERLGGGFSASPIAAEGRLYFQNEEGVSYVLKAAKTFQLLARNDLGERTLASPAATDGTLFLRSKSHLWRIGSGQGTKLTLVTP